MNKSVVIIISITWFICISYTMLAGMYELPYRAVAMTGSWIASLLLLICIIIYIRKHRTRSGSQM